MFKLLFCIKNRTRTSIKVFMLLFSYYLSWIWALPDKNRKYLPQFHSSLFRLYPVSIIKYSYLIPFCLEMAFNLMLIRFCPSDEKSPTIKTWCGPFFQLFLLIFVSIKPKPLDSFSQSRNHTILVIFTYFKYFW